VAQKSLVLILHETAARLHNSLQRVAHCEAQQQLDQRQEYQIISYTSRTGITFQVVERCCGLVGTVVSVKVAPFEWPQSLAAEQVQATRA
jgi:hypothetical protein